MGIPRDIVSLEENLRLDNSIDLFAPIEQGGILESPDINTGYGGIEWLDIHFFEQYGQQNIRILGEAWGTTIASFLDNNPIDWNDASINGTALVAKNAKQWLLIGDPSLRIGGYRN